MSISRARRRRLATATRLGTARRIRAAAHEQEQSMRPSPGWAACKSGDEHVDEQIMHAPDGRPICPSCDMAIDAIVCGTPPTTAAARDALDRLLIAAHQRLANCGT